LEQAQRIAQVPGVVLPDKILQRLSTKSNPADQAQVGLEIAVEQVQRVQQEGWAGLYLMSPGGAAGILAALQTGLIAK